RSNDFKRPVLGLDEPRLTRDRTAVDRRRPVPRAALVAPEMDQVRPPHGDHLEVPVVVLDQRRGAERPVPEARGAVPRPGGDPLAARPVRERARGDRRHDLEVALNPDALHKPRRTGGDSAARQLIGRTPTGAYHSVRVDVPAGSAAEMVPLTP